ncbi:MAG: hypothetical protein JSW54_08620 [Fidelibacterota bacterium]|nr:MAG: hypothetical protein JSW54_08620 [Candidatus Neomarinimicrobiota bacterium]
MQFHRYLLMGIIPFLVALAVGGCAATSGGASPVETAAKSEAPIEFIFPEYTGPGEKPKIAVVDFTNDTPFESDVIGAGVANTFITALVKSRHYRVIERSMLGRIIEEQNLGMSGALDAAEASEVGKILGVDYIVAGSISEFGVKTSRTAVGYSRDVAAKVGVSKGTARVALDVRVIDPNTAEVVTVETGVGSHFSSNIGVAFEEISLLTGVVGFDETLIGKATRKAVFDIVNKFIIQGF